MTLRVFKCPFYGYRFKADPEERWQVGETEITRRARVSEPAIAERRHTGMAGILEGLYFHAIAYSDVRGKMGSGWLVPLYLLSLASWLVSLLVALLVFFPRAYAGNISSWRESKATVERIVTWKHTALKVAGGFLVLGALALFAAMGDYLAG
jgi:hypothetical protein